MYTYKLSFSFDYGSGILLWSENDITSKKYDYSVNVDDLPISDKLKKEIQNILNWYDSSINQEYRPDSPIWGEEECRKFNKSKNKLFLKIVEELGHDYLVIDESHDLHELKESRFPMPDKL